jgi:hypothetical protein
MPLTPTSTNDGIVLTDLSVAIAVLFSGEHSPQTICDDEHTRL